MMVKLFFYYVNDIIVLKKGSVMTISYYVFYYVMVIFRFIFIHNVFKICEMISSNLLCENLCAFHNLCCCVIYLFCKIIFSFVQYDLT
jgi:hypothetical protein